MDLAGCRCRRHFSGRIRICRARCGTSGGTAAGAFEFGKAVRHGEFCVGENFDGGGHREFLWCLRLSQKKGTLELPELTLAIKRPGGLLLVDGCSHAGIEAILEAASAIDPRTEIVFGGLHLVTTPVEEIDTLVGNLQTKWKVQRIAPGHCTGEPAFARLRKALWGEVCVCRVGDGGGSGVRGEEVES